MCIIRAIFGNYRLMIGVGVHEQQGSLVIDQGSNAGNSAFGPVPGTILDAIQTVQLQFVRSLLQ